MCLCRRIPKAFPYDKILITCKFISELNGGEKNENARLSFLFVHK